LEGAFVTVEVLYFDGCPNHEALVPHLRELLGEAGVNAEIELRRVPDDAVAERERFLGSPTVRIDGRDVEPGADERTDFGLKCRLYRTERGFSGLPDDDWILAALGKAGAASASSRAMSFPASKRQTALAPSERDLHRGILRTLAEGGALDAVALTELATAHGLDAESGLAALEAHDLVHLDTATGAVRVAYPFSARPTGHRVRLATGAEVFAMCAIDALGIPVMTGEPAEIHSEDPSTGAAIEISLEPTGDGEWRPAEAMVVLGCSEADQTSASCMCPNTNFVASSGSGEALVATLPAGCATLLSLPEAIELGREAFGELLTGERREASDADQDRA
jgi:Alkylmercury lyase